jgi:hypothetical protein
MTSAGHCFNRAAYLRTASPFRGMAAWSLLWIVIAITKKDTYKV